MCQMCRATTLTNLIIAGMWLLRALMSIPDTYTCIYIYISTDKKTTYTIKTYSTCKHYLQKSSGSILYNGRHFCPGKNVRCSYIQTSVPLYNCKCYRRRSIPRHQPFVDCQAVRSTLRHFVTSFVTSFVTLSRRLNNYTYV